jgi:hypothetical protein
VPSSIPTHFFFISWGRSRKNSDSTSALASIQLPFYCYHRPKAISSLHIPP